MRKGGKNLIIGIDMHVSGLFERFVTNAHRYANSLSWQPLCDTKLLVCIGMLWYAPMVYFGWALRSENGEHCSELAVHKHIWRYTIPFTCVGILSTKHHFMRRKTWQKKWWELSFCSKLGIGWLWQNLDTLEVLSIRWAITQKRRAAAMGCNGRGLWGLIGPRGHCYAAVWTLEDIYTAYSSCDENFPMSFHITYTCMLAFAKMTCQLNICSRPQRMIPAEFPLTCWGGNKIKCSLGKGYHQAG